MREGEGKRRREGAEEMGRGKGGKRRKLVKRGTGWAVS